MMNDVERLDFLKDFAQRMKLNEEETENFVHHSMHWQGRMWLDTIEQRGATIADWKTYDKNFINHITDWKVLRIPMAGGKELCVQVYRNDPEFPEEITIYLKHTDGFEQDVALIRPHYDDNPYNPDYEVNRNKVDVLVYADDAIDGYSERFVIEASADEE